MMRFGKIVRCGVLGSMAVLCCDTLYAEVKVLNVDPAATGNGIETVRGPHLAMYDPQATDNHRLFLYLVGTRARAESGAAIAKTFAREGYHVLVLDYENGLLAASCVHSEDRACFDVYRSTIVKGTPGTDKINVTPENSIVNRLQKLLVYLTRQDIGGGWGEFLATDKPVWAHIAVGGHSQGSGHAAYIGKLYPVDYVLMFSGPQDYLENFKGPAPWEFGESATPRSRFFAFLNLHDPFNEEHQLASCEALMAVPDAHPLLVVPGQEITGLHQVLVTDIDPPHAHGTTVSPQFENVWKYFAGK